MIIAQHSQHSANLAIETPGKVGRRILSNARLMFVAKTLSAVVGFATLIVAAKGLSKTDFGIVLFLHGYVVLFSKIATFESWRSMIRFGNDDLHNKDITGLAKLIRFCLALDYIAAMVAFLVAIGFAAFVVNFLGHLPAFDGTTHNFDVNHLSPYLYGYCALILVSQQGTSIGIFRLFNRFDMLAARALVMPVVRLGGVLIAFWLNSGFEGYLIAWFAGSLLGKLALPVLAFIELQRRHLTLALLEKSPGIRLKRQGVWPFVWKSNIDATLAAGMSQLPLILMGPLLGTEYVAIYKIAEEVANLLSRTILLIDQVVYPEFARMVSRGEPGNIWKIVVKSAAVLLTGGIVLSVTVALARPAIVDASYGAGYQDIVQLSILLVLAAAITGVNAPIFPVFYATHRPETAIWVRSIGLVTYLFSLVIFSQWFGFSGPGWAAITGNLVSVLLAVILVRAILLKQQQSNSCLKADLSTP